MAIHYRYFLPSVFLVNRAFIELKSICKHKKTLRPFHKPSQVHTKNILTRHIYFSFWKKPFKPPCVCFRKVLFGRRQSGWWGLSLCKWLFLSKANIKYFVILMIVKPADISRELSVILMYLISLIARPSLSVIFRVYVPGAWWCTSAVGCGNIKQIKPSIIVKWLFFSITCREERYCGN